MTTQLEDPSVGAPPMSAAASRGSRPRQSRRRTALHDQRMMRVLWFSLVPAVAGGAVAGIRVGSVGDAVILAAAIFATSLALERDRIPLHLMPLASLVVRTIVPALGAALALLVFVLVAHPIAAYNMSVPVIAAWFALAVAAWRMTQFDLSHQVRVAMIGSSGLAIGMDYELRNAGIRSYKVVGWLEDEPPAAEPGKGPHWLGSLAQVRDVVEAHSIELLVHSSNPGGGDEEHRISRLELFERVADTCLDLPVRLLEASQLYENLLGHVPLGQSTSAWFQYLLHPRYRAGSPLSKRIFDLLVGTVMLIALLPVLFVCALVIKLTDGGPVFYRQRRVGEGGREFEMVKLRSMRVDSEDLGAQWSNGEDDRVTPIGGIMRRLHLDEMPQIWNVLRGEMTIVGPRPERRSLIVELERQLPYYDRRHLVKPGLAGWAQACCGYGGSQQGTGWKLCHDLYYLKHRSAYFDWLILIENVRVSLRGVQFGLDAPQEQFILRNSDPAR